MRYSTVAMLIIAISSLSGCATAGFQAGEPFTPGEARFFDDGIDLIENLESLSGEWGFKAQDELTGRVQLADLVAVVDILAIQVSQDVDGRESRRIDLQLVESLYGQAPGKTFSLSASEESTGFVTILRSEQRLSGRKIVFVRFFLDEQGALRSHFHLSPDSEALRASTAKVIANRRREQAEAEAQAKKR